MAEKSKILVIGGTGYIGEFIVKNSAKAGHPTFVLVRENTASNPEKSQLIESFKSSGVTILYGDLYDHNSLVKSIKKVDIVISCVGKDQIADQVRIIAAIKEAGNIKRFLPSEFGTNVDRVQTVEPAESFFRQKANFRRVMEAEGVPYTIVSNYCFAGFFLPKMGQHNGTAPPRDKVVILGDGNPKGVYVEEEDIATYTIKGVEDPRTLNKTLYIRPPANILSFNEIVSIWEKKIGKTLEKIYVPEDQLLKKIKESPFPLNFIMSLGHYSFVKGDASIFETGDSSAVDATELFPEVKYTTVDQYLDRFV
ncbi:eugenol synthase 1-like [Humulus lupulus]|uniref:eugenol synthase 1-like n=1 Tax=Humulus lupulus TaxID=3486 RepID=UPI002B402137|nr:eugenol synthase 1-like [Humulus lupulus]